MRTVSSMGSRELERNRDKKRAKRKRDRKWWGNTIMEIRRITPEPPKFFFFQFQVMKCPSFATKKKDDERCILNYAPPGFKAKKGNRVFDYPVRDMWLVSTSRSESGWVREVTECRIPLACVHYCIRHGHPGSRSSMVLPT